MALQALRLCIEQIAHSAMHSSQGVALSVVLFGALLVLGLGKWISSRRAAMATVQPATVAAAPAQATAQAGGDSFDKIHNVIQERCTVCHSAKPTSPLFSAAPAGVMFDTPQQIQAQAARIQAQAVASQIMPLGNITQMTTEERKLVGDWIAKGAPVN